jgi:hypothetical protein
MNSHATFGARAVLVGLFVTFLHALKKVARPLSAGVATEHVVPGCGLPGACVQLLRRIDRRKGSRLLGQKSALVSFG